MKDDVFAVPRYFTRFDLTATGLLPFDWKRDIHAAVEEISVGAELTSEHPSSLEPSGTRLEYKMIDGVGIKDRLSWLDSLYRGAFLELASEVYGDQLVPSDKLQNGVNVNVLQGAVQRYERHVDTNPMTALLFVTSHLPEDGGQLIFQGHADKMICEPVEGHLLVFDARNAPHEVAPLAGDGLRISVPMNYFTSETLNQRSTDLDHYLYSDLQ